jgi:S1-C subfamily serine protease
MKDSPAAKAGLHPTRRDDNGRIELGDLIVAIEDKPVQSSKDLLNVLDQHQVGDTVKLKIRRDGQEQEVNVTLEAIQ